MPKPNKIFPTQPTLLRVMRVLRKELASSGYHIFGVSKRFRKTQRDFLAVKTDNACNFLLAHGAGLPVQLEPYASAANMLPARLVAEKMQFEGRLLVHWARAVNLRRMNLKLEHFVPPEQQAELARLFPDHTLVA